MSEMLNIRAEAKTPMAMDWSIGTEIVGAEAFRFYFNRLKILADRGWDDFIGTLTRNGYVDKVFQRNDFDFVGLVAQVDKEVSIDRACDFSSTLRAGKEPT